MIREDTHLHSNFSDGKNSIEEMAQTAIKLGLKKITFTDHVWETSDWIDDYVEEIKEVRKKYPKIKIYSGIEAKVIDLSGNIDANKSFFNKVDYVLGAFHRIPTGKRTYLSSEEIIKNKKIALNFWYKAIINLLKNKNVDIIAHPTFILKRYKIKLPKWLKKEIAENARKTNKTFEINRKHKVPNKELIKILKEHNIKLIYGSDSHNIKELKMFN
ncbi:MAG: PHP domain-containing protein [Patescibacteria group bacterium]|nr:PHP domain-containing protein [Patescibacteria group bacterium]